MDLRENKILQNEKKAFLNEQIVKTASKLQQIASCRQVYQEIDEKKMVNKIMLLNGILIRVFFLFLFCLLYFALFHFIHFFFNHISSYYLPSHVQILMNVQKQLTVSREKVENVKSSILLSRKEVPRFLTKLTKMPYVPLTVEEVRTDLYQPYLSL